MSWSLHHLFLSSALLSTCVMSTACLPQPSGQPISDTQDASFDVDMPRQDASMTPHDAGMQQDSSGAVDQDEGLDGGPVLDLAADMSDEGGEQDMGAPPPSVPVLVGLGHFGRRVISCDGGQSWQEAGSFLGGSQYCMDAEDDAVCYPDAGSCSFATRDGSCKKSDGCDCDHSSGAPMGLTFAGDERGGSFVGVFGWGNVPTTFVRSDDGVNWVESEGVVNTPAGVAYGDGLVMLGTKSGWHSADRGESWQEGGSFQIIHSGTGESVHNTRKTMYVPTDGGRFFVSASSGKTRDDGTRYEVWGVAMSADGGATWSQPTAPDECGLGLATITGDQERIIMLHDKGLSCVSTDGGSSFTAHQIDVDGETFGSAQGTPLYDGTRFWIWGRRTAYSSVDGIQWQRQEREDLHLGSTAYDPQHQAFVSVRGGWKNWYDRQEFYRSVDGVDWQKLDEADYTRSHPIRRLAFGWAKPGTVCPSP